MIFYEDRKASRSGLFESFYFILRRILFVLTALFLVNGSWSLVAFCVYLFCSFFHLVYLITIQPMLSQTRNFTEIINELFVLMTSYCAMLLIDPSKRREELLEIGSLLKVVIYTSICSNLLIVIISLISQARRKIKIRRIKK